MGFSLQEVLTKEEIEFLNALFPRKEQEKEKKQKNKKTKKGGNK